MIVVWRVTERCNLSCAFCAYDRSIARSRRTASLEPVLRLGAMLGEHRHRTGERILVSWLGGEPFLWPALGPATRAFRENYGLDLSATTNGTMLERASVRALVREHFAELTVSVDGFAAEHEGLRGWPGGWQRLRAAVRALARERAAGASALKLRANVVLMRDNLASFAALCTELADWGCDEITFNALGGRDRPEFFPAHGLRSEDVEALRAELPALRTRLAARGVRLCGNERYLDRLAATAAHVALPVADCKPGERFLFVDEQNRIAPCSFTTDELGLVLGADGGIADVGHLPRLFAARREHRRSAHCADCPSTQVFAKFAG